MATQPNTLYGSWYIQSLVVGAGGITLPPGQIGDAEIEAGADIDASKLIHQFPLSYYQVPGSAVVAATVDLHIVRGATGTLKGFQAAITGTIATGGDRHVTVDLQKSTGAAAFATVLSAVIDLTSASVLRTAVAATLSSTALVAGDILRVVVAVSGAAGNQALGLVVTTTLSEAPT